MKYFTGILALIPIPLFLISGCNLADTWAANIAGIYKGEVASGSTTLPVTTLFSDTGDRLSGRYSYSEPGNTVYGELSGCQAGVSRKVVCKWEDKYGSGQLVMEFSADFSKFTGKWSIAGDQTTFSWTGVKDPNTDLVTVITMPDKLQYSGFSVVRPKDIRWYIRKEESNENRVVFRMNTLSATHTVYATVGQYSIPHRPETLDELSIMVEDWKTKGAEKRFKVLSYDSDTGERQGAWVVNYRMKTLDMRPLTSEDSLFMTQQGYVVLHPDREKIVISAEYSERGLEAEIGQVYEEAGKTLIQSVEIQSLPDTG